MKRFISYIVYLPIGAIAVLFLVANRASVAVSLDPFSTTNPAIATPALPMWFWLMAMLFLGFLAGAIGMWRSGAPRRSEAKANRKELKELRRALTNLETENASLRATQTDHAVSEDLPILESS